MESYLLDEYGKGRLSVIRELQEWCLNEIEKVKEEETDSIDRSISKSTRKGIFAKVLQRLDVKEEKLKLKQRK